MLYNTRLYKICPRDLCDELITRPKESYRLWRVVVCDLETSKEEAKRPLKGCEHKPTWVMTPRGKKNQICPPFSFQNKKIY